MVDAARVPEEAQAENHTAFRCVQQPGDLIYVPDSWGHGVLNLEASVGYAQSFNGPHKKFNDAPHRFLEGGAAATVLRPQQ